MKPFPYLPNEIAVLIALSRSSVDTFECDRTRKLIEQGINWSYVIELAKARKLAPLLFQNLSAHFTDQVPEVHLDELRAILKQNIRTNLLLTQSMVQLVDYFSQKNIPIVPFKGPVLAYLSYQTPAQRLFCDLDFLVLEEHFEIVAQHFLDIGFTANDRNDPDYYRQSQYAVMATNVVIDLHYALTPVDCFVQVDTKQLMNYLTPIKIQNYEVSSFGPEDLFVVLSVDAAKSYWQSIMRLVDMAELLRRQVIDWKILFERAETLACLQIVQMGLFLTHKIFQAPIPEVIQTHIHASLKWMGDDDTLYRQVFDLDAPFQASLSWHRFNMRALGSIKSTAQYLYRLGKFSIKTIPGLKYVIRT